MAIILFHFLKMMKKETQSVHLAKLPMFLFPRIILYRFQLLNHVTKGIEISLSQREMEILGLGIIKRKILLKGYL
jgi:hypothetical protein